MIATDMAKVAIKTIALFQFIFSVFQCKDLLQLLAKLKKPE